MARSRVVEIVIKAKDEASKRFSGLADKIGISNKALAGFGIAAGVAAAAAVKAFKQITDAAQQALKYLTDMTNEMATFGDSLDKMSLRTNVAAEDLAQWGFVLERAGGQLGDLETAVRRMSKSMFDYQRGLSTAREAWDALGVSPVNAMGQLKGVNEILLEMADAFPRVSNEAERMAIAQETLGRGGLRMAAAFAGGRGEIEEQLKLFRRLNGEMGEEFTKGAAAVIDAQTDMKWAIRGLKADLLEPLNPIIAEVIDDIAEAVGDLGKYAEQHQDDIKKFGEELATLSKAALQLAQTLTFLATEGFPKFQQAMQVQQRVLEALLPWYAAASRDLRLLGNAYGVVADKADQAVDAAKRWNEAQKYVQAPMRSVQFQAEFEPVDYDPNAPLGPFDNEAAQARMQEQARAATRDAVAAAADEWNVATSQTVFDPVSAQWIDVPLTAEEIAKGITQAREKALDEIDKSIAEIKGKKVEVERELGDAFYIPLPEDLGLDPENAIGDALIPTDEELERMNVLNEQMQRTAEQQKEIIDTGDEALQSLVKGAEEAAAAQALLEQSVRDVAMNFERLASNSIKAWMSGEAGAMKFGTLLRTVVIDALSAVIAKLLVIKTLSAFVGLSTGGGFKLAEGGAPLPKRAVHYAGGGYEVTGGRLGIDSVPAVLMPGEYVIDRSLTQQLKAYLQLQKSSIGISQLGRDGGRGDSPSVVLQVARPVGYLDMLDLGDAAVVAGRKIAEANL